MEALCDRMVSATGKRLKLSWARSDGMSMFAEDVPHSGEFVIEWVGGVGGSDATRNHRIVCELWWVA